MIVLTGVPDVPSAAAAVELGAFRYLLKPTIPANITYNPSQVRGGFPSTATLTLNGKAPAGNPLADLPLN